LSTVGAESWIHLDYGDLFGLQEPFCWSVAPMPRPELSPPQSPGGSNADSTSRRTISSRARAQRNSRYSRGFLRPPPCFNLRGSQKDRLLTPRISSIVRPHRRNKLRHGNGIPLRLGSDRRKAILDKWLASRIGQKSPLGRLFSPLFRV